ncbi:MAG: inositol monophosphatase family protein [Actinomycetes bacterium]
MSSSHFDPTPWLDACRRMVSGIDEVLADHATTVDRAVVVGLGEGGDRTLVIDELAEDAVFAELAKLSEDGLAFTAVGEERGEVDFGSRDIAVLVDPIDGSLNAKRVGGPCALSIAVATGWTVEDVVFGFVHDFHAGEEWVAVSGEGATLNGLPLDPSLPARIRDDGKVEILGIESADPRWVVGAGDELLNAAYRLRALGAIAVTLCQVAAARYDAMVSLRDCRAVDAAAAQLVVREAGGLVCFPGLDSPLAAPLDLVGHAPVAAGRDQQSLDIAISVAARAAKE